MENIPQKYVTHYSYSAIRWLFRSNSATSLSPLKFAPRALKCCILCCVYKYMYGSCVCTISGGRRGVFIPHFLRAHYLIHFENHFSALVDYVGSKCAVARMSCQVQRRDCAATSQLCNWPTGRRHYLTDTLSLTLCARLRLTGRSPLGQCAKLAGLFALPFNPKAQLTFFFTPLCLKSCQRFMLALYLHFHFGLAICARCLVPLEF